MSDRRLLIDTDAFIILAGTNLIADALNVLGYMPQAAIRLHALPFMLGRKKSLQSRYPADVLSRARSACDLYSALEERERNSDIFQRLIAADDRIDSGEALLLAVAIETPQYALLTGDRRAIEAFGSSPDLVELREKLTARVVCLEVVFRLVGLFS